jgi:hypothetical protein
VYFVPGEHDTFVDNGKAHLDRFGQGSTTNGCEAWTSKASTSSAWSMCGTSRRAASTAYSQPAPGDAPAPGPLRVVAEQLVSSLGIRQVSFDQKAARRLSSTPRSRRAMRSRSLPARVCPERALEAVSLASACSPKPARARC